MNRLWSNHASLKAMLASPAGAYADGKPSVAFGVQQVAPLFAGERAGTGGLDTAPAILGATALT